MNGDIEEAFSAAAQEFLGGLEPFAGCAFHVSQTSDAKEYPCLTTEAEDLPPTNGRASLTAGTVRFILETKIGVEGANPEVDHKAREKALVGVLKDNGDAFLARVNEKAAGIFDLRGFVESSPAYSNDDRSWRSEITIIAGIQLG